MRDTLLLELRRPRARRARAQDLKAGVPKRPELIAEKESKAEVNRCQVQETRLSLASLSC